MLCLKQPCSSPPKPNNLSDTVMWSGDCDGGNWIELVDIKDNVYRFRIYQDYDGVLLMDADFMLKNCNNKVIDMENWQTRVCCYSNSMDSLVRLGIKNIGNEDCNNGYLESIYPAYGGVDWEIIQEKYLNK